MSADWENGGFAIYVHWPFCEAKCPYCDFNSHVAKHIDQDAWEAAYLSDIDRAARELKGRVVQSVFFGGGTPSLMNPHVAGAVIDRIAKHWPMANDPEITLEANPSSVEASKFAGFSSAGVNRVSLGVQALNDTDLKALGRLHSAAEARTAFDIARKQFSRVSFDLIYARQNQTLADWEAELTDALDMAVDHLSLYQLTIEDGTAFGDRFARGGLKGLPSEDLSADMYELTLSITSDRGYDAYEVSNHAKPGAESRHNLVYWRYGDYLGIGPGAHGRLTLGVEKYATEAARTPGEWLANVKQGLAEKHRNRLTPMEQANEYLILGLRLTQGIDLKRLNSICGQSINQDSIADLVELGFATQDESALKITGKGRLVLNSIIEKLAFTPD